MRSRSVRLYSCICIRVIYAHVCTYIIHVIYVYTFSNRHLSVLLQMSMSWLCLLQRRLTSFTCYLLLQCANSQHFFVLPYLSVYHGGVMLSRRLLFQGIMLLIYQKASAFPVSYTFASSCSAILNARAVCISILNTCVCLFLCV